MTRKAKLICLLIATHLIVAIAGYDLAIKGKAHRFIITKKGVVTGILHNTDHPSAIIDGQIVYEGDTIHGMKVIKIYKNKVEFEKNKKSWTARVHK